jgi:hypothetical protein
VAPLSLVVVVDADETGEPAVDKMLRLVSRGARGVCSVFASSTTSVSTIRAVLVAFLAVEFRRRIIVSGSLRLGRNAVVVVVVVVEEVFRFRSRLLLLNDLVSPGFNPFNPHVIIVGRHESRRL